MPKSRWTTFSSSSEEEDDRDYSKFTAAFLNENDRCGDALLAQLRNNESAWLHPCFFCHTGLSEFTVTCTTCENEFAICKHCFNENRTLVVGCNTCIFCLRRLSELVQQRLFPDHPLPSLKQDPSGIGTCLRLLRPTAPTRRSPRLAKKQ